MKLSDANNSSDAMRSAYKFSLQSKAFTKQAEDGQNLANKLLNEAMKYIKKMEMLMQN